MTLPTNEQWAGIMWRLHIVSPV